MDIDKLRKEIDQIDAGIVKLIAERRDVALEIAKLKQKSGPRGDKERLEQVLSNVENRANELGLDGKRLRSIWTSLVEYMIDEQMVRHPYKR